MGRPQTFKRQSNFGHRSKQVGSCLSEYVCQGAQEPKQPPTRSCCDIHMARIVSELNAINSYCRGSGTVRAAVGAPSRPTGVSFERLCLRDGAGPVDRVRHSMKGCEQAHGWFFGSCH